MTDEEQPPEPAAYEVVFYHDSPGGTRTRSAIVTYTPDDFGVEGKVTGLERRPLYTLAAARQVVADEIQRFCLDVLGSPLGGQEAAAWRACARWLRGLA
jgi:hypothetical protein